MSQNVEQYLTKKKNSAKSPEVAEIFQVLERNYVRKLWHQLTLEAKKAIDDPRFKAEVNLKEFYDNFIYEFEIRINSYQLVEIAMPIAKQIFTKSPSEALEFLAKIEKTVHRDKQAQVGVWSGQIELRLMNKDGNGKCVDITTVRDMIESTQKTLDELPGVTPVHATFYRVSSNYLREIGNYASYYREALRYLGCEDINNLSGEEKHMQAMLLGFAALLGENIYNFGELLAHPVLKSLENTPEEWLVNVLFAFNSGNLLKFRENEKHWSQWPDIVKHRDFLENKIRLLCMMEIALARPSKERYITFNEIAEKALVDLSNVEFLVMKALSKGLVRGSINQVEGLVSITWVQPRVLSLSQISSMADRIGEWRRDVESMESLTSDAFQHESRSVGAIA
ncbi:26S proteasome non-ATPase regulatory subunit 13 [Aphelenchoides bicaudatus]|nr:26S proteasome non-ATPase regulatory subunit 13 [Aphelenchoides bicaudatus]